MNSRTAIQHTLLIVEREDDGDVYQATKVEHPPDSPQTGLIRDAMTGLVTQAEADTGDAHRLVEENDKPEVIQMHYESHEEAMAR